jgi:MFS family permease
LVIATQVSVSMSDSGGARSAVLSYYLFRVTDSVGFIWPVFTLFLLWNDLTFTQIGTLSAISAVLVVVFEVPTGYLADRIGHRNTLAIGMGATATSIAGFVAASTFRQFVALYVIWALANALRHGAADAWLYEMLRERLDSDAFTRVRGRGGAVYQVVTAVTMIVGGLLYAVHPTYPFAASAVLSGLGVGAILLMPQTDADADQPGVTDALTTLREQFTRPSLRAFVPFIALFFAMVTTADTYIQPITVDVIERLSAALAPVAEDAVGRDGSSLILVAVILLLTSLCYLRRQTLSAWILNSSFHVLTATSISVPEEATLGFVYAGFALAGGIASYNAERIRGWLGLRRALLAVPLVTAAALVFPLAVPLLAVPAFFLMRAATDLSKPLVNQYLNDRAGSASRATVLSAAQMSYAVVRAPLKPLVGVIADTTSPFGAIAALGGGFLIVGLSIVVVAQSVIADGPAVESTGVEESAG